MALTLLSLCILKKTGWQEIIEEEIKTGMKWISYETNEKNR